MSADWWRQAVVYEVFPRSFADADGDGFGDLKGLTSRIPYLASLGVDAVWLAPHYPSPLADFGYDISDQRDVDPTLGTLEDFDELVAGLHAAGLKVIVDIVPNHTSDQHEWFQAALAAPKGSPERDRYIFRDGLGPDKTEPPADWISEFDGPTWHPVGDGQWYLHLFAPEQPDLNWDNPEVREDLIETLRFWSDRGVDGFRIDVAWGCAKSLPEVLPTQAELDAIDPALGVHPFRDRDEVHDIYADWRRQVFDAYDPPRVAVAEAWVPSPERRYRYASPEGLGQAFNFDLLEADFDAAQFREIISTNLALAAATGSSPTWVFSNHDVVRQPTRYGLSGPRTPGVRQGQEWLVAGGPESWLDAERGLRRARAATLVSLALPGSAYLYQGEELGLHEVADIPAEAREDPWFFNSGGERIGRDGSRVPLPWTRGGSSFGFGPGGAHLPQPAWFADYSVEAEDGVRGSMLEFYRAALALRRQWQTDETLEWLDGVGDDVLRFRRPNGWEVVANYGTDPVPLPEGRLLLASGELGDGMLPGETAVWVAAR